MSQAIQSITREELRDFCLRKAAQANKAAEETFDYMNSHSSSLNDNQYESLHIAHSTYIGQQQAYRLVLEEFNWNSNE